MRARTRRPRRSVSCCSAVYAVAPWCLDGFRPLALLIPLPAVAPDAKRAVVGAVVFRHPLSSVNGEMAIPASVSPGDWSMASAPTRSPLRGLPRLIESQPSQESVNK